jgi:hypothetical protein
MQYKSIFIVLILGWISALIGCGKGGAACDTGLKPKIKSNGPIGNNEVLTLSSTGVSAVASYAWTGPNGYTSTEAAPKISSPSRGRYVYSLTVTTTGGCTYSGVSDTITVTGPTNACGLDSNQATLQGVVDLSFNKVIGTTGSSDYMITATNGNATITVEFPGNQPPAEGIYSIQKSSSALPSGFCRLIAKAITTAPWTTDTNSGSVYVSIDNNVTTISFCTVKFNSTEYSGDVSGAARIIWKP